MRKLLKLTLIFLASALIAFVFGLALLKAIVKEDEMKDDIRTSRCASFGENLPAAWLDYCKGE